MMTPIQQVIKAWIDSGSHPDYHQVKKNQLCREWPALARALNRLTLSELTDKKVG